MKKRLYVTFAVLILSPILAFSSWSALYDGWEGHPRILAGLIPTSLGAGISLDWQSGTSFYAKGRAGYFERMLWQRPTDGMPIVSDPLLYDLLRFDLEGGLAQRLGSHMASIGYRISYERPFDSMIVGTTLASGVVDPVAGWSSNSVFGRLSGIKGSLEARYRFDRYHDNHSRSDGILIALGGSYGTGSYLSLSVEAKGAKTLLAEMEGEHSLFSIVVVDRIVGSYDLGASIPLSVQEVSAFGAKVRGFSTFQYPVALSMANQLDLRFSGPSVVYRGIFPRMTLFCDVGYGHETVANSTFQATGMLASGGVSLHFTLGPYMDLGYQMAYLLVGENHAHPGAKMVGELSAHLRF